MPAGRPKDEISLYDKYVKGNEDVLKADCRNGADNRGLAKRLGCSISTYKKILREDSRLKELLKEDREIADMRVESALYKRAIGYEYEETTTEVMVDAKGNGNTSVVKKTKKHVPGDTTAQIFWLKNRKPNEWSDVKEMDESWINALAVITGNYKKEDKKEQ